MTRQVKQGLHSGFSQKIGVKCLWSQQIMLQFVTNHGNILEYFKTFNIQCHPFSYALSEDAKRTDNAHCLLRCEVNEDLRK